MASVVRLLTVFHPSSTARSTPSPPTPETFSAPLPLEFSLRTPRGGKGPGECGVIFADRTVLERSELLTKYIRRPRRWGRVMGVVSVGERLQREKRLNSNTSFSHIAHRTSQRVYPLVALGSLMKGRFCVIIIFSIFKTCWTSCKISTFWPFTLSNSS